MPDYSFIQGFDRTQLYEHFFWTEDPSLAVINPPVDTAGFGAAFPYFDIISQWVMNVFSGKTSLPEKEAMRNGVLSTWLHFMLSDFMTAGWKPSGLGCCQVFSRTRPATFPDTGTSSAVWSNLPIWPLLPHFRSMV